MFVLMIFKDYQQKNIHSILKFRKMKDIIKASGGVISYNTIRQKDNKKYVTKQNLYRIIKI